MAAHTEEVAKHVVGQSLEDATAFAKASKCFVEVRDENGAYTMEYAYGRVCVTLSDGVVLRASAG